MHGSFSSLVPSYPGSKANSHVSFLGLTTSVKCLKGVCSCCFGSEGASAPKQVENGSRGLVRRSQRLFGHRTVHLRRRSRLRFFSPTPACIYSKVVFLNKLFRVSSSPVPQPPAQGLAVGRNSPKLNATLK